MVFTTVGANIASPKSVGAVGEARTSRNLGSLNANPSLRAGSCETSWTYVVTHQTTESEATVAHSGTVDIVRTDSPSSADVEPDVIRDSIASQLALRTPVRWRALVTN